MIERFKPIAGLVPVFAWFAVGCSQDAPAPTVAPTVESTEAPVMFTVIGENTLGAVRSAFAFEGEDLDSPGPTITVRAGQPVTITLKNTGESLPADHNFVIVAEKSVEADPLWGAETEQIGPGEQQTITFSPDTPGSYFYICSVDTHMNHGMWGVFIVEG